jgi:ferritin-like metal-binding protein YciE
LSKKVTPQCATCLFAGAASRLEHYEMAGYQAAIALAEALMYDEAAMLLNESLLEEQAADTTRSEHCSRIMSGIRSADSKMAVL